MRGVGGIKALRRKGKDDGSFGAAVGIVVDDGGGLVLNGAGFRGGWRNGACFGMGLRVMLEEDGSGWEDTGDGGEAGVRKGVVL
jgi:hypothetical protein